MKAEELISMAAAHGIDLPRVAGNSSNLKGRARVRRRTEEECDRKVGVVETVTGHESRVYRRPAWSLAELGQAAQGVPEREFRAACYAFAHSMSYLWTIHADLVKEARELQRRHHWPDTVRDIHGIKKEYLEHVCKLVLDEDASPNLFKLCDPLYAIYLAIPEQTWEREVHERFAVIKHSWLQWIGTAAAGIQKNLEGE